MERFVRCPVGFSNILITNTGTLDCTSNCHLPEPSPKDPLVIPSPAPDSKPSAVSVLTAPAGTDSFTTLPGDIP